MLTQKTHMWIARVSAFVWGFAFIHLFKYILEKIYPFWSQTANISLFAYILIFIAWLSYTLFFNFHPYRKVIPGFIYHTIFTANAFIFYIVIVKMGEQTYLYFYPLFFTFQFFIYFFLFSSIFPFLMRFRVSILAGMLPGLITYPYIGNVYVDIFLPAIVYLLPYRFFTSVEISHSKSQQRMLPLRQGVDLLRYLFLGLAFFGIFDKYREHFYLTAFIIGLGPMLTYFFQIFDKKNHHIKYGINVLAFLFIIEAVLYRNLPLSYWSAIGFSFLTIWEGVYFNKIAEGDLKREQILSGIALSIVLFFYFISPEWVAIVSAVLILLIQIRIAFYIIKGYRKTISILFGLSLVVWSGVISISYMDSFKRDFFANIAKTTVNAPVSLSVLNLVNSKSVKLATNLFPEEVVKNFSKNLKNKLIPVKTCSPEFLTNIESFSRQYSNPVQIYDVKNLRPYETKTGQKYIFQFMSLHSIKNVYLYNSDFPGTYFNEFNNNVFPATLTEGGIGRDEMFEFGTSLAAWYASQDHYDYALSVLKDLMQYSDNVEVLRRIAHVYGVQGDTENQIEYRQKILDRGFANIEDKNVLMELYFLSDQIDKAEQICDGLIAQDPENIFTYMDWKYKIIKRRKNHFQMEVLGNTVRSITGNFSEDKVSRKNNLLQKIQEDLSSNPEYNEIFNKEKTRQENITYPE